MHPGEKKTSAWRETALLAAIWLVGTALLVAKRPGYGFPPFELLDSWFYTSYQWDLRSQIQDFGATYYESRLSWILPGALLHHLFAPQTAVLTFKLIVSALFALASGAIVRRAAGLPAAMLAVTLSLFAPQFVAALHADYIDTPVIVYAALAIACITVSRDSSRWYGWTFLGGCALAGMLIANLSSVGAPGLGIAVFHLLWLRWSVRRHLLSIAIYLLAIVVVVVAIGVIHVQLGGAFYFLKPQVTMMLYFHEQKTNPWSAANWLWVYRANWLILPAAVLLWGIRQSILPAEKSGARTRLVQALTAALFVSLTWAFYVESKGVGVLLYYYYASYHLCFALPLLAALCWPTTDGWIARLRSLALVVALAVFCFIGNPPAIWQILIPLHRFLPNAEATPWLVAAALLLVGLIGSFIRGPRLVHLLVRPEAIVLGLFACSMSMGFRGYEISDRLRERYMLVYRTYWQIAREFPRGSYLFWVHPKERNGISLASTKLWGYRMITDKGFPELGDAYYTDKTLILPCPVGAAEATFATARTLFDGWSINLVHRKIIPVRGDAGVGYDLLCFSLEKRPLDPDRLPPGMKPPAMLFGFVADGASPYPARLGVALQNPGKDKGVSQRGGVTIFTPSTPQDHAATYFQICPPADGERVLSIVTEMPAAADCVCVVQDENFRAIARFVLREPGRAVHRAVLPADARELRVIFECPEQPSTPLPSHVLFYAVQP